MTTLQMQLFARLANNRRLGKTANEFGISPSSMTKQLDKLEDELGEKLYNNASEGITLTEAGKKAYPILQSIAWSYDILKQEMVPFTKKSKRDVHIVTPFHQTELIQCLLKYDEEHSDINLIIEENSSLQIQERIYSGDVELGFGFAELMYKKLVGSFTVKYEPIYAVVSNTHYLADRQTISLNDLRDEELFMFKDDSLFYMYLVRICIANGFVPKDTNWDCKMITILDKVGRGKGVALLPASSISAIAPKDCTTLQLEGKETIRLTAYTSNTYPSEDCVDIIKFVTKEFSRRA